MAIKNNYLKKGSHIVFSDKPTINQNNGYWILNWNQVRVPVPVTTYTDVFIFTASSGQYEFILRSDGGVIIAGVVFQDELQNDMFSQFNISNSEVTTAATGKQSTNIIFGGPIRHSDLIIMGYELSPNNLTCKNENVASETGKSIALILKNTASPHTLISVYKGVGSNKGWFENSTSGDSSHFVANILPDSLPGLIYQVSYKVPINKTNFLLPYAIDEVNEPFELAPPKWLESLNFALESKTNSDWGDYIRYAKQEKISTKSIESVIDSINYTASP